MNVNYTYNNKYQQPSFLQSMLYGAVGALGSMGGFGSLTGLGGCFGGGMMNMGMGMGMGGSLFNMCNPGMNFGMGMYGMGGFGCCDTSDRAVFSAIGTTLGSFGVGALIQSIGNKKTPDTTNIETKKNVNDFKKQAEKNVDNNTPSLKTNITNAKNKLTAISKVIDSYNTTNDKLSKLKSELNNLKNVLIPGINNGSEFKAQEGQQLTTEQTDANIKLAGYNDRVKKLENEFIPEAEGELRNIKSQVYDIDPSLDLSEKPSDWLTAIENEIKAAEEKRTQKINEEAEKLEAADKSKDVTTENNQSNVSDKKKKEIKSELDKTLDKGDGNTVSRLLSPKQQKVHKFYNAKNELISAIESNNNEKIKVAAGNLLRARQNLEFRSKSDNTSKAVDVAKEMYTKIKENIDNILKEGYKQDYKDNLLKNLKGSHGV